MSYIQANDLNTIEEEINKFQSSNFNIKNNTHIVIQTLNGYEINLNEADSSSKELHSLISNIVSDTSGNETILKDDHGKSLEVDIGEFIDHLNKFHKSGISTHTQSGCSFTVDDGFRIKIKKLYEK